MPVAKRRSVLGSVAASSREQQQAQQRATAAAASAKKKKAQPKLHAASQKIGKGRQQQQQQQHQHQGKKQRPRGDAARGGSDVGAVSSSSSPNHLHVAHNVIHRQAAFAVQRLVTADETKSHGASLKSLTLAPHIEHKKPTFAVTCQVLQYLPLLKQIQERAGTDETLEQISVHTWYVLVYELLLGQGLGRWRGPAEKSILKHKGHLKGVLKAILEEKGVKTPQELLGSSAAAAPRHPRWVRVNTLKQRVPEALRLLSSQGYEVSVDPLLPDVLRLPPGTDLHDHPLVLEGALILQSKASCMPAHALSPEKGWTVMDCCAAPGNKTTHVAALLQGAGGGRVLAFDKDPRRLQRLKDNAARAGAAHLINAQLQDFLSVDPQDPVLAQVRGIILDPSCSGSGTVFTRMDHLLPSYHAPGPSAQQPKHTAPAHTAADGPTTGADEQPQDGEGDGESEEGRVEALALFQESVLLHALSFPAVQRLVYSTCSVHERENERVVAAVMGRAAELGFELQDPFPSWHRRGVPLFEGCEKLVRTDALEDGTDGFFVAVFNRTAAACGATTTATTTTTTPAETATGKADRGPRGKRTRR